MNLYLNDKIYILKFSCPTTMLLPPDKMTPGTRLQIGTLQIQKNLV